GAEHGELDLGDEIFEQRRVDELRMLGPGDDHEGPDQNVVDLLGEEEADDERHEEGKQRLDQPAAQLDQVLEERRLGGLDVLVGHAARPASLTGGGAGAAAPFSSCAAAAGTDAGGGSMTTGGSAATDGSGAGGAASAVAGASVVAGAPSTAAA